MVVYILWQEFIAISGFFEFKVARRLLEVHSTFESATKAMLDFSPEKQVSVKMNFNRYYIESVEVKGG